MTVQILVGDCRKTLAQLAPESVHTVVTSPPYFGLRDYGQEGQLGQEKTPEEFTTELVRVFQEVKRVLRPDGTVWLNLGDSYAGTGHAGSQNLDKLGKRLGCGGGKKHSTPGMTFRARAPEGIPPKNLIGIPWRVAFALQADGWYLRQDIIWHKPNPMPESVTDRCTKSHEYIFLLSKSPTYYFDAAAIREPWVEAAADIRRAEQKHEGYGAKHDEGYNGKVRGQPVGDPSSGRNKRSVWTVSTKPFPGAHFAVYPPDLIEPCIKAGCPEGGTVLDPFGGAGTTALVADRLGRNSVLCELNPKYVEMARTRLVDEIGMFTQLEIKAA